MTNDPDVRFASSLVDYVFRRLAIEYLPPDKRTGLGVQTIDERKEYAQSVVDGGEADAPSPDVRVDQDQVRLIPLSDAPAKPVTEGRVLDAPLCYSCGAKMQPAGSCYVCTGCGSTSGCS
jgi:ribonucleoside-diphosphate reductase alpha chain